MGDIDTIAASSDAPARDARVRDTHIREELLAASDDFIDRAVAEGDPMVLRGLIYQLTGDAELEALMPSPRPAAGFIGGRGLGPADAARVRRKAADFLKAYRDRGAGPLDIGPRARLPKSMALTAGMEPEPGAIDLWLEELALDPWARGLEWTREPPPERLANFTVTIIGAGMGGLNAAIQLRRAGIACTVIEKNDGVGGTWYENRYPGARVDTPSRMYTHIFGVDYSYPYQYCPWQENRKYFDWVADTFDVRRDIQFRTEVRAMAWDEASATWTLTVHGPDGERTLRSNAVITAVGFLNRPLMPDIPGMDAFTGPSWHTARWPEGFAARGKRIAVIGSGCTSYQMVPELRRDAGHVVVFQRTPQWLFPARGYLSRLPEEVNWLDRNLPFHTNFLRMRLAAGFAMGLGNVAQVDPTFQDEHAVSATNRQARDGCIAFLESKLGDPDLVRRMIPPHPVLSARPVLVDPEYSILDAIASDNVTLETDPIVRITADGVETQGGTVHAVDAIVYATGFHATEYLFPMAVTGRDGRTLAQLWEHTGAQGYRGAMIPGFPNLFTLYGPNTNGALLIPSFQEMETVFALKCIERLVLDGKRSVDVRDEPYRDYNALMDARNRQMAWSDPRAQNYYWTRFGRSATQNPFGQLEMWRLLHEPDFDHLDVR